jgi:hypothetical protein
MSNEKHASGPLDDLLAKYGKHCPRCHSGQISSDNSTPLKHRCLDCGHKFVDSEAIVGKPAQASGPTAEEIAVAERWLASVGYSDSRIHSSVAIAQLLADYAACQSERVRELERMISPEWKEYCKHAEDTERRLQELVMPRHEGSVDERKGQLAKWSREWLDSHKLSVDDLYLPDLMWDLEHEAECRGWQTAHDKRECGHPLAFYQDKNWPASEQNYNPETYSGEPPMEYSCLLCDAERRQPEQVPWTIEDWKIAKQLSAALLRAESAERRLQEMAKAFLKYANHAQDCLVKYHADKSTLNDGLINCTCGLDSEQAKAKATMPDRLSAGQPE